MRNFRKASKALEERLHFHAHALICLLLPELVQSRFFLGRRLPFRFRCRLPFRFRCRRAAVVAVDFLGWLVHAGVEVDVGGFTPSQHIVVHRCKEKADEAMPERSQLVQRRRVAAEPREHLFRDGRVHVADAVVQLLDFPWVTRAIVRVTETVPPVAHEDRDLNKILAVSSIGPSRRLSHTFSDSEQISETFQNSIA